jgi:hypothetical protein
MSWSDDEDSSSSNNSSSCWNSVLYEEEEPEDNVKHFEAKVSVVDAGIYREDADDEFDIDDDNSTRKSQSATSDDEKDSQVIVELPPAGLARIMDGTVEHRHRRDRSVEASRRNQTTAAAKNESSSPSPQEDQQQQDSTESSSFLRDFVQVLQADQQYPEGVASSDAGSSISSFVPISHPAPSSSHQNSNMMLSSSSSFSSWSHVTQDFPTTTCSNTAQSGFTFGEEGDQMMQQQEQQHQQHQQQQKRSLPICATTSYIVRVGDGSVNDDDDATTDAAMDSKSNTVTTTAIFDLVSLSSSLSVRKCRRCHFHNATTATTCEGCQLALVSNHPNLKLDEQNPRQLQQREQEKLLRLNESAQPPSSSSSLLMMEHSKELSEELETFLEPYYGGVTMMGSTTTANATNASFRPLPADDLRHHLTHFLSMVTFMDDNNEFHKVALGYKLVRRHGYDCNQTKVWNAIRSRGFARDNSVGFQEPVQVATTLQGAWGAYRWFGGGPPHASSLSLGVSPHSSCFAMMPPIHENTMNNEDDDDEEPCPFVAWIVAVAESNTEKTTTPPHGRGGTSIMGNVTHFEFPEQVVPLICFDPKLQGSSDEIRVLMNGLSRIIWNFFGGRLNLKSAAPPRINLLGSIITSREENNENGGGFKKLREARRQERDAQLLQAQKALLQRRNNDMKNMLTNNLLSPPVPTNGAAAVPKRTADLSIEWLRLCMQLDLDGSMSKLKALSTVRKQQLRRTSVND